MAVATEENKTLIASSEFDASAFIKGIDAMTLSLQKLSVEEDKIRQDLRNIDTALKANRAEYKTTTDQIKSLDTSSKTYTEDLKKLTTQQTLLKDQQKELRLNLGTQKDALAEVTKKANDFRAALVGINAVAKQVAADNRGRTLFDVSSLNAQVQQVSQAGSKLRNIFQGKISTAELDKFEAALAGTTDEMKQLDQVVTFVKSKLETLDPNTEEFAELTQVVEAGEQVLAQYGTTVEDTGEKAVSSRAQLRAMREELQNLEAQGKDNTKEFQDLAVQAGRLEDQIGDTQQRIKILSSDTKNLDFGIGAIRGAAAAFGVAEGSAALFGLRSEDLQASLQRLNAIMLVLNGLQEIQTLLQKQSVVAVVGQEIATKGAAVAQRIYAIAVGTSTGALRAFRVALLATGIGAFIVLIGLAADAMGAFSGETEDATDMNKLFNDSLEQTNLLFENRAKAIKAAADADEERARRGLKFTPNTEGAIKGQEALDAKIAAIREKSLKDQRDAITLQIQELRIQQDDLIARGGQEELVTKINENILQLDQKRQELEAQRTVDQEKNLTREFQNNQKAREREYNATVAFLERLTTLQREFRDKQLAAQPQDEAAIRQQFKNALTDATADLDKEVKSGKLTRGRADILKTMVEQINKVDLTKALEDFRREALEAEQDLNDQLFDVRLQNGRERAELIRDQFTREAAIVRIEARQQGEDIKRERDEVIQGIRETQRLGLIDEETAQLNVDRFTDIYAQLLDNLGEETTRKQEEISSRIFEAAQEQVTKVFSGASLIVSQITTGEILKLSERYQQGKITYEEFQKELTRITTEESTKRIAQNIREQTELLANAQKQLAAEKDPERQKALQDRIAQLQKTIDDLRRQLAVADAAGTAADNADRDARLQQLAQYAQAVGGIVSSVVQFWQQANEAEQRSLERSIQLQEARVEAAVRIAERGNSEYLRLEEDRLNELQVKQENAARRQLAINAVLQTSQALTAFVSAMAQGIATGGPLGGIAIAGAVIAAIGAGYSIISSLQSQNTQQLKEGTKSVQRRGEPAGVDTISAKLTEGEAVLPVDVNKVYKPTVEAIFDKKIPADVINNFVATYHNRNFTSNYPAKEIKTLVNNYRTNTRVLPRLDHERMSEAAGVVVRYDSELLNATREQTRKISEHADLLRQVDKRLATMGVNVSIDKNGLAVSLMRAMEQFSIDKRV